MYATGQVVPRAIDVASTAKKLTKKQRGLVQDILREKRNEHAEELDTARRRLKDMTAEARESVYGVNAGHGSDAAEMEKIAATVSYYQRGLSAIDDSLRRMNARWDTFDLCEGKNCGKPIGFDRLSSEPSATHCILCEATGNK